MTEVLEKSVNEKQAVEISTDEEQIVVFRIGQEEFGIDIDRIEEIVRLPEITKIPRSPDYILGLCNLRGNIIAAIDTRCKFNMEKAEADEQTRMIIVEINGDRSGLVIDSVSEVTRVSKSEMENTPDIATDVDRSYIEGVVNLENGKRLVLILNLLELIQSDSYAVSAKTVSAALDRKEQEETAVIDEEQLVTFNIEKEEYAFNIQLVKEILKVSEISKLPDSPDYVKGIITLRNKLIPVIDFRTFIRTESMERSYLAEFDQAAKEHLLWEQETREYYESRTDSFGGITHDNSPFKKAFTFLDTLNIEEIKRVIAPLVTIHNSLHAAAVKGIDAPGRDVNGKIRKMLSDFKEAVTAARNGIVSCIKEEQKILVLENNGTVAGILVDSVNEVLRVEKKYIDSTPMLSSDGERELEGIAKLEEGKRLIMIISGESVFTAKNKDIAAGLKKSSIQNNEAGGKMNEFISDEKQLVTFNINDELYGLSVLQIQEINRIPAITKVPRSPDFVEGVVNLRGEVLPVIDLRKIFEIERKEIDDRTRIIITDISNKKTGLIVDKVNEVVRIPQSSIEPAPELITATAQVDFIEGVGRLKNKDMIIIIQVENMLTKKETEQYRKLNETETIQRKEEEIESEAITEIIDD